MVAHLMALVPSQLWVIANMKETQMNNIHIGQPVTFTVDALKMMNHIEAESSGVVESILVEDGQPVEYDQPRFTIV